MTARHHGGRPSLRSGDETQRLHARISASDKALAADAAAKRSESLSDYVRDAVVERACAELGFDHSVYVATRERRPVPAPVVSPQVEQSSRSTSAHGETRAERARLAQGGRRIVTLRISSEDHALLDDATVQVGDVIAEFVLRAALREACEELGLDAALYLETGQRRRTAETSRSIRQERDDLEADVANLTEMLALRDRELERSTRLMEQLERERAALQARLERRRSRRGS